jgi:hypothetical protein
VANWHILAYCESACLVIIVASCYKVCTSKNDPVLSSTPKNAL